MRGLVRLATAIACVVLACLAALELGVRVLVPQELPQRTPGIYLRDEVIGWRRNPNVRAVANTGDREVQICTDERGDRIDCNAPRSRECSASILAIGDSYVAALAVPFRETVWSRLERDTAACVHIAGVSGYWPQQYVALARERLMEADVRRYDLVILSLYAGNDFVMGAQPIPPTEVLERPQIRLLPKAFTTGALRMWLHGYNEWLEARSHLYVATRFAIRRVLDPEGVAVYGIPMALLRSRFSDAYVTGTTSAVVAIASYARDSGSKLLVTVIPIKNQVTDPTGERLLSRFENLRGDLDMDLVGTRFVAGVKLLAEVDSVVDLLPHLRTHADKSAWGTRDPHFSPHGHELWYEAIREPVRELLGQS